MIAECKYPVGKEFFTKEVPMPLNPECRCGCTIAPEDFVRVIGPCDLCEQPVRSNEARMVVGEKVIHSQCHYRATMPPGRKFTEEDRLALVAEKRLHA